jgi:hypothetical protein
MEKIFVRYAVATYTYGALRTIAYAPALKKEEYVIDRAGRVFIYTIAAPFTALGYLLIDLRNLEHVVRKMPGQIDRSPWS